MKIDEGESSLYAYKNLLLTEVALQELAARALAEAADGLLLDLADALAREAELLANLLKGHLLAADAEEGLDDVALALGQGAQRALNLAGEALVDEPAVGVWRVLVDEDVQEAVLLAVGKRRVDRDVATRHAERILHLVGWQVEFLGKLLGGRLALVLLLELGVCLIDLIEGAYLIEWQADDAALLSKSLED